MGSVFNEELGVLGKQGLILMVMQLRNKIMKLLKKSMFLECLGKLISVCFISF